MHIADEQDLSEQLGDVVAQIADESGDGGEVRRLITAQRNEGDVLVARPFDRAAADDAARVRKQDQLEQHRGRIRRRSSGVVAVAGVQTRQIDLVFEQMIERVFEGAWQQLPRQIDGDQLRVGVDHFVAGHRHDSSTGVRLSTLPPE